MFWNNLKRKKRSTKIPQDFARNLGEHDLQDLRQYCEAMLNAFNYGTYIYANGAVSGWRDNIDEAVKNIKDVLLFIEWCEEYGIVADGYKRGKDGRYVRNNCYIYRDTYFSLMRRRYIFEFSPDISGLTKSQLGIYYKAINLYRPDYMYIDYYLVPYDTAKAKESIGFAWKLENAKSIFDEADSFIEKVINKDLDKLKINSLKAEIAKLESKQ